MELIILLVAFIFNYGIYLAAPLFVAYIAFKIGQGFNKKSGISVFQWILPLTVLGTPILWALAGYAAFKEQCTNLPTPSFLSIPNTKPDGILLDETGIAQSPFHRSSFVYERLPFAFYEQSYFTGNRTSTHAVQHFRRTYADRSSVDIAEPTAEYGLVFSSPQQVPYWWHPPIYISEIQVLERKSNMVVAKAFDLIFGGGMVGDYLHIPAMNYDYRYLSCGFTSKEVGAWRTRHGNDPRYSQYVEADTNFVSTALTPAGQQRVSFVMFSNFSLQRDASPASRLRAPELAR